MNKLFNYHTVVPDFISMQRISFCWFLKFGLNDELVLFSRIQDYNEEIEYLIFGQEYTLVKPVYNVVTAKKYITNYSVQLMIPIQIRNKHLNTIKYYEQFPVLNFPLMTTFSTFIINGCERVVISQIIRSPGVYFEEKQSKVQSKVRTSISRNQLSAFLRSGEAFITESKLFFSFPKINIKPPQLTTKLLPDWKQKSIYNFTIKFSDKQKINPCFYFLTCFKLYKILINPTTFSLKNIFITLFFKWLSIYNNISNQQQKVTIYNIFYLLNYMFRLIKLIIKYELINLKSRYKINKSIIFGQNKSTTKQLLRKFKVLIKNYEVTSQKNLNYKLLILVKNEFQNIKTLQTSQFLNKNIDYIKKIHFNNTINLLDTKKLKLNIYFSSDLKEHFKYTFLDLRKPTASDFDYLVESAQRHKYLNTKTQFLSYSNDLIDKINYSQKYKKKNIYNAVLIPEYGSWIRFIFQKNNKLHKYPLKTQDENIYIQVGRTIQEPILSVLKEIGLTDLEIYNSLSHSDFFYFNKPILVNSFNLLEPLLRFDLKKQTNISEFTKIFDNSYYRLGKVGRLKVNKKLNINIDKNLQNIIYEDVLAILDHLLDLSLSKKKGDDIDHLKNRRVRSVGELLQNLFRVGLQRLLRKLIVPLNKYEINHLSSFRILGTTIKEFFTSSQLSQYMDQTNPLSSLTHRRRISGLGPGGFNRDRISFSVRDIHPSHYGRICPIETPEGQNVGLISSLTTLARVNKSGFLETPFWRVLNGKIIKTGIPIYLTAEIEDHYKIAPADIARNSANYLLDNLIPVRYNQEFIYVTPFEVDFISISSVQLVSLATSLIPFFEHDDANRALMGSNMQRQSVPLLLPQKPIVGTGLEHQVAIDSGMAISAEKAGTIQSVMSNYIIIKENSGKRLKYILQKYKRSNQETCINQRPIVWKGQKIKSGQILTDGPGISVNELALGQNLLIAYMPWNGYNFEDAVLINERLVYDDLFTSLHIERYEINIDRTAEFPEKTTKNIPNLKLKENQYLNDEGIITIGTFVQPYDILVGKIVENDETEQLPESKLLRAIFGTKAKGIRDTSYRMPKSKYGRVIETLTFNRQTTSTYKFEKIHIFIAQIRKVQVGDKIAGRHGNKGIISRILSRQDMPFLPDGTPIDILLNPLGVPSRMNVGQLYECLLGFAGDKLHTRFKILPFDEMYGKEASRILINKKLRQASVKNNEAWIFNPYAPGKVMLMDGRTGKHFENPITVGNAYMLKLIHLIDDKMHSRSTGPYSLVTQQPLGGKARQGGQRFGEMEVWALEGFGAAFTLKELLTIKSDDMQGRTETLTAIIKGQKIPKSGIPESFKVLLQELRAIGLDISTYKIKKFSLNPNQHEVETDSLEKYNPFLKTFSTN